MKFPFFHSRDTEPSEREAVFVTSMFAKFRRIQTLNTRALGLMADMERVLGGEFIFDRAFIEESVRHLGMLTHHIAYCLNAMSGDGYVRLYDRYEEIREVLQGILCGGEGPFASALTLPYDRIGWEMENFAGTLNVSLSEARTHLALPAPGGFAVTAAGCRLFFEANGGRDSSPPVLPEALEAAIRQAVDVLDVRAGKMLQVRVSPMEGASGQDAGWAGDAAQVLPDGVPAACCALLDRATVALEPDTPLALAVHVAVPAELMARVRPLADEDGRLLEIIAWPSDRPDAVDRYRVQKNFPFGLLQSELRPRETRPEATDAALAVTSRGLLKGSALLGPGVLKTLAEGALKFERILGGPHETVWALYGEKRPVVWDIRTCRPTARREFSLPVADVPAPLIRGGETVQTGVAAGMVCHVAEGDRLDAFPQGGVLVARHAVPGLYPFVKRASAVVTEVGSAVGHLATLIRELRIPSVFGLPGALDALPEGQAVTVDAGDDAVYLGVVEPLLVAAEASDTGLNPRDAEYVALRRLLRWITPLEMLDPFDAGFRADRCRSYHDIIHFAHERSVEALLSIRVAHRPGSALPVRQVQLDVPVALSVMDLGGGVAGNADPLALRDISSLPLRAFLSGLNTPEAWSSEPVALGLRDMVAGLDRTLTSMAGPGGGNHAIAAEAYMNVGLRLGYHYCIIDSHTGARPEENHLYFRFAGGLAGDQRMQRRAGLVQAVLQELGFRVVVKRDLVVGNLKMASREDVTDALRILGALVGFTRQLDLSLTSEPEAKRYFDSFRERFLKEGFRSGVPLACEAGEERECAL